MPDKWAEKQYEYEQSDEDQNLTRWGETKEEFLISMKEYRKEKSNLDYLVLLYFYMYVYTFLYLFVLAN